MIPLRTVVMLAVVAGASAGCAAQSQPEVPTAPSPPGRAALIGQTWAVFEIDGQGVDASDTQRRPSIQLSADGNRVGGSTGCNRIAGTFTQDGNALRFSRLVMTRVACVPDRSAIENAFVMALEATTAQAIENQMLELRDATGAVRMRLRAS
jgi:heat shock protein HslJ